MRHAKRTRRWALTEGQDFVRNHRVAAIDFATVHSWVDKCALWHTLNSAPAVFIRALLSKIALTREEH